jgi:hypothetical protein
MRHWNDAVVVPQLFSPHTCNVSLDNILGGKRSRRTTTAELGVSSPKKTPKNPRTPRSRSVTPAGSLVNKAFMINYQQVVDHFTCLD